MRSTVSGRAPGTTSGTVVLTWLKPTLDASTTMKAIAVTRFAVIDFSKASCGGGRDMWDRLLV